MKVAVVVSGDFTSWDERSAILSHFVGALACVAEVDLLVADGPLRRSESEGAATREVFPARPPDLGRLHALDLLAFGPQRSTRVACGCARMAQETLASDVSVEVEEELLSLAGGDSPELFDHLARSDYDLVVFSRPDTASTVRGLQAVGGRVPTMLLPLMATGPRLRLRAVRDAFASADCVATTSAFEAAVAADAVARRVVTIGSVVRVHSLALRNEPVLYEAGAVVMARDWSAEPLTDDLLLTVRRLNRDLGGAAVVRLVGPGWASLPDDVRAPHAESRLDVWRWVARSIAFWDPDPHRVLGRGVLEAMQYGTPVVTAWHGAGREHAEQGNGGLWYRTYGELLACIEALVASDELGKTLGRQGRTYSTNFYADTDAFVHRVGHLVAGLVDATR